MSPTWYAARTWFMLAVLLHILLLFSTKYSNITGIPEAWIALPLWLGAALSGLRAAYFTKACELLGPLSMLAVAVCGFVPFLGILSAAIAMNRLQEEWNAAKAQQQP